MNDYLCGALICIVVELVYNIIKSKQIDYLKHMVICAHFTCGVIWCTVFLINASVSESVISTLIAIEIILIIYTLFGYTYDMKCKEVYRIFNKSGMLVVAQRSTVKKMSQKKEMMEYLEGMLLREEKYVFPFNIILFSKEEKTTINYTIVFLKKEDFYKANILSENVLFGKYGTIVNGSI